MRRLLNPAPCMCRWSCGASGSARVGPPIPLNVVTAPKRYAVIALRQPTPLLSYWESALKNYVAHTPSKREAPPPYYHWRELRGRGFVIWISQTGYSEDHRCHVVRVEMSGEASLEGAEIFENIVELAIAEFHSNTLLESGSC